MCRNFDDYPKYPLPTNLHTTVLFGLVFCFVNSVEECNNELDLDCFCYDEPRDNFLT